VAGTPPASHIPHHARTPEASRCWLDGQGSTGTGIYRDPRVPDGQHHPAGRATTDHAQPGAGHEAQLGQAVLVRSRWGWSQRDNPADQALPEHHLYLLPRS
jgi:hypothetical protein